MSAALTPAYRWFRAHGSRPDTARVFAAAEAGAAANDLDTGWTPDWKVGSHREEYGPDAYATEPRTCETAVLLDPEGEVLAAVGCVDDANDDDRRIIAAELAAEAMDAR